MKTSMTITVTSPEQYEEVFPEEGQTLSDYKGKEEELESFRKTFAKEIHKNILDTIEEYFKKDGWFEEEWIDNLEEHSVEGWESLEDYKITLTTKK